jgi:flagellar hook-basal body complex protein FliE
MIENASGAEAKSDQLVEALAKGEPTDVHSVMVAMTEAELAFRTVVEVRNRLIEAYQEIQRMPV